MNSIPPSPPLTLDAIPQDVVARIVSVQSEGAERRRMFDLGFTPGTTIWVETRSPLGDPIAYRVRDTVVALRRAQAQKISVSIDIDGG